MMRRGPPQGPRIRGTVACCRFIKPCIRFSFDSFSGCIGIGITKQIFLNDTLTFDLSSTTLNCRRSR